MYSPPTFKKSPQFATWNFCSTTIVTIIVTTIDHGLMEGWRFIGLVKWMKYFYLTTNIGIWTDLIDFIIFGSTISWLFRLLLSTDSVLNTIRNKIRTALLPRAVLIFYFVRLNFIIFYEDRKKKCCYWVMIYFILWDWPPPDRFYGRMYTTKLLIFAGSAVCKNEKLTKWIIIKPTWNVIRCPCACVLTCPCNIRLEMGNQNVQKI